VVTGEVKNSSKKTIAERSFKYQLGQEFPSWIWALIIVGFIWKTIF
jgi:hypothetical protein